VNFNALELVLVISDWLPASELDDQGEQPASQG